MSSLTALLGKLEVYSKTDSHRQVYDTAKLILQKDRSNIAALKRSLVALINMDNYTDAKKLIDENKSLIDSNKSFLLLELAYVYYKLESSKEEDLLQLADFTTPSNIRGFNHILAQFYYRIGDDVKALELYKLLINDDPESLESLDLSVNERAVISQLKFQNNFPYNFNNQTIPISKSYNDSYDQLFNDSLILIVDKKYNDALNILDKTYNIAEKSLSDYETHEKFMELAPIQLQIAYVYILLAKYDGALSLLNKLNDQLIEIKNSISNINNDINFKVLDFLIKNNKLVCIQKLQNQHLKFPELLYRELDPNNTISLSKQKLTIPQLSIMQRNHLLLSFFCGKKSNNLIKSFIKTFPNSILPNALYSLTDINFNNNKQVYNLSIKNPSNLSLTLLASQMAITSGNYQRAISLLENTINNNEKFLLLPSVGKLLYSLYETLDCKKLINQLLTNIANLLLAKDITTFTNEDIDYSKFISLKLLSTDETTAKELLSKIEASEILTVECSDADINKLISNVDVDSLISDGITPLLKSSTLSSSSKGITSYTKVTKPKSKRSRSKRLPKDTSRQIDPERWLPMKDRTYYKMKKSKKNKNTQGGEIDAATEKVLNMSNSTPAQPTSSTPTPSNNNNNKSSSKKNKKKKGKK